MNDGPTIYVLLCLSAFVAGAVNSLAGGGTLLTFPVLLSIPGMSSVQANATSTVALMPGSAAAAWAYRRELLGTRTWLARLIPPSLFGGIVGSALVVMLPGRVFDLAIPWLLLSASLLFLFQPVFGRVIRARMTSARPPFTKGTSGQEISDGAETPLQATKKEGPSSDGIEADEPAASWPSPARASASSGSAWMAVTLFQVVVAIYGGYFGAGIGILMLTALAFVVPGDIHRLNGLKTFLAACINGVSVLVFLAEGKVVWSYGLTMALAGIAGGFCGAHFGRRLPTAAVRWFVIVMGLTISAVQFAKQFAPRTGEPSRPAVVSPIDDGAPR
jgi:uncharacterized protein